MVGGLLGILFGLLGIFSIGLIFVPLAGLCSAVGLLRGMAVRGRLGVGLSLVGGFLAAAGFSVSPSLWLLTGAGAIVGLTNPVAQIVPTQTPANSSPQSSSLASTSPRANAIDVDVSTRIVTLTHDISSGIDRLSQTKSMGDKLQMRFVNAASRIADFEEMSMGQPYSLSRTQAALKINGGFLQDGTIRMQLVQAKSNWAYQIDPLIQRMDKLNIFCLEPVEGRDYASKMSSICTQLKQASIQFRIAAQAAKTSIDAAETAYQNEARVAQNILRF